VVKVAEVSLPAVESAVGIDLGLTTFAALSTGEKVVNPRWLRQRERALRRSQRNMSRKQNGSRNQEKARRRLARQHAKVTDARRDFHHQLSTRLIRENQAVYVETLNIAALGRSALAKVSPMPGGASSPVCWSTRHRWPGGPSSRSTGGIRRLSFVQAAAAGRGQ
jgi:transposase